MENWKLCKRDGEQQKMTEDDWTLTGNDRKWREMTGNYGNNRKWWEMKGNDRILMAYDGKWRDMTGNYGVRCWGDLPSIKQAPIRSSIEIGKIYTHAKVGCSMNNASWTHRNTRNNRCISNQPVGGTTKGIACIQISDMWCHQAHILKVRSYFDVLKNKAKLLPFIDIRAACQVTYGNFTEIVTLSCSIRINSNFVYTKI